MLTRMARIGANLLRDVAQKHCDGEFLPDLTSRSPHLNKKTQKLLQSYCDLIIDLVEIFRGGDKIERARVRIWIKQFRQAKKLEHDLFHHSYFVEIGGE